jgi:ABC-2 type transport system permease protein
LNFGVLFRKEFTEQIKTHKMLVVVAILLLFGFGTPLLLKFLPEFLKLSGEQIPIELPAFTAFDAIQSYISTLGQIGLLVAVLVAMGSIAQERERRTAIMTLSKPAGFGAFVVAKLAALMVTFGCGLLLGSLGCYLYTVVLLGPFDAGAFTIIALLISFYFLVCLAVTLMYSAFFRNQLAAGGTALATLIILALLSNIPNIGRYLPVALMNNATSIAGGSREAPWSLFFSLIVSAVIVLAAVIICWQVLKKREV